MNNFNSHCIKNENDSSSIKFLKWPLDMDDDEFRAGYPFTSIAEKEIDG